MGERVKINAKKPEGSKEKQVYQKQQSGIPKSVNSPVDKILILQRTIGNQAVQRLLKDVGSPLSAAGGRIQAKLKIGQPNDVYEQEADRVADMVMRMPEKESESVSASVSENSNSAFRIPHSAIQMKPA